MLKSYVFIEMVAGQESEIVERLEAREPFSEVRRVTGPYDVVAVVETEEGTNVNDIVVRDIHACRGVVRTTTCVCLDEGRNEQAGA